MQKILLSAQDASKIIGVTPDRFIKLQDSGKLPMEFLDGLVFYNLHELKKISLSVPKSKILPESLYATVKQAIDITGVCRKTFYSRVKQGLIQLHKDGKRSYVLRAELYATDELF